MKRLGIVELCLVASAVWMLQTPVQAVEFQEVCSPAGDVCYFSPPNPQLGEFTALPVETFLARQGKFCLGSDRPGCLLLDPPVPNFLFFEDTDDFKCAAIDYAGLAASFVRSGTTTSGLVRQRERADGFGVDVEIVLETENALAWVAQDCGLTAMLFGSRVSEILEGGEPVFGNSRLQVAMIHSRYTGDLPDLFQLYHFPQVGRFVTFVSFAAEAQGTLRVPFSGLPAGTRVKLTVSSVQNFGNLGIINNQIDLSPLEP